MGGELRRMEGMAEGRMGGGREWYLMSPFSEPNFPRLLKEFSVNGRTKPKTGFISTKNLLKTPLFVNISSFYYPSFDTDQFRTW